MGELLRGNPITSALRRGGDSNPRGGAQIIEVTRP